MRVTTHIDVPALPDFTGRSTGAWAASLTAHALLLLAAALIMSRSVLAPVPEPSRIVYVEPAVPPPAPPPAVSAPEPKLRPRPIVPEKRLVVPPKTKLEPEPVAPPEPSPAEIEGGEIGGKVGGVKGDRSDVAVPADRVAHPPVVLSRVMPDYPMSARVRGLEGLVVLRAIVDHEGRIEETITVLQSIAALDASAVTALKQWRFQPGKDRDGNTVRVIVDVPIRFQLR